MRSCIDISWPLCPEMTSYKNNKPLIITHDKTIANDGVADSSVAMNLHTGTHIDAPAHFIADGATVDQLCLDQMNGLCRVLDLTHVQEKIEVADLVPLGIAPRERILLKTKNSLRESTDQFDFNFVYLSADAAAFLVKSGVCLVGIDALGIERNQPSHATHTALFKGGVIIVEGLRLYSAVSQEYELLLLPLALVGVEAAPARALLYSSPRGLVD